MMDVEPIPNDYLDELRDKILRRVPDDEAYYRENAYRRGFHQGYYAALTAVLGGASLDDAEAFCMGAVFDWRNRDHQGGAEPPPKLEAK